MRSSPGLEEMQSPVGQELGTSEWQRVTQDEVNLFAKATHDHQSIHMDPERCRRESPFDGPIAHGYYTIALAPAFLAQVLRLEGVRMGVTTAPTRCASRAPCRWDRRCDCRRCWRDTSLSPAARASPSV